MTTEKLTQANELSIKIKNLKRIIDSSKNQTCEWIEFTFGNGSNKECVCNDSDIIQKARDLIVKENELKLASLEKEFSEL